MAPSNTELLDSIGALDEIIGACSYCDYPPAAQKIERVGSFVSVNLERLTRLHPDTVLLVSGQESVKALLEHNGFRATILKNAKLNDISNNLRELGRISGCDTAAEKLAARFDASLQSLHQILSKSSSHPTIFYCVWPQPLLSVGQSSFLNDVINTCGGKNVVGTTVAYPRYSPERLLLDQPDVLILPHEAEQSDLVARPPWNSLKAVKEKHFYFVPPADKDRLSRPTLRIIDGLFWLSSRLHPELQPMLNKWRVDSLSALTASP